MSGDLDRIENPQLRNSSDASEHMLAWCLLDAWVCVKSSARACLVLGFDAREYPVSI